MWGQMVQVEDQGAMWGQMALAADQGAVWGQNEQAAALFLGNGLEALWGCHA